MCGLSMGRGSPLPAGQAGMRLFPRPHDRPAGPRTLYPRSAVSSTPPDPPSPEGGPFPFSIASSAPSFILPESQDKRKAVRKGTARVDRLPVGGWHLRQRKKLPGKGARFPATGACLPARRAGGGEMQGGMGTFYEAADFSISNLPMNMIGMAKTYLRVRRICTFTLS